MRFLRRPSLATNVRLTLFLASSFALLLAALVYVTFQATALVAEAGRDLSSIAHLLVGAAVIGASFFFTLLIGLWLARQIGEPRQKRVDAAKTAADGKNYSVRADRALDSEIGARIDSANSNLERFEASSAAQRIGAHKAVEEENRWTQELLETVFENGPDLIFVKDAADFRYVRVNKAFEKALGFSRRDVIGKTDFDLFPKEEAEFFRAKDRETLNSGQSVDIQEEPVDTRDGGRRIVRTKKLPIAFGSDRAQYLVGIAEDITEQKQAARALEISDERYRSVLEHAADAFFLHDLNGRFIDVNRQACESLGYTREELLRLSVPDVEIDFDATRLDEMWSDMPPGVAHSLEGLHRRKDGTTFPVEIRLARVPLADVSWVMALVRDVSVRRVEERELKAAKEQAEKANRLKSEFLANVSHEIRTPMNAVIGMTDLLARTRLTRKQQDYVQTVRSSGDLLLSVIDDILDFSKLEAGELRLETRAFDVDDVVESVLNMLGYRAYTKDVELACRCRLGVPPRLIGDPDRLQQVLVNLVGNAVKFTERGEVVVEVSPLAEMADEVLLRFAVQDTGPGIPPEFREHLFTPFSQWDTSTTRRYRGTGLGLAICKKLVENMGGEITVQSQPGEGSTFSFKMPFRRAAQVPEPQSGLQGRRALLVDDNPAIRGALGDFLATLGMRIDAEARGAAALALLRREAEGDDPYDVALIDTEMPSESGLDLASQIRADPAIAATGLVLLPPIARPLGPGVVSTLPGARCVNKPVLPRLLRQQLLATLGLSGTHSGNTEPVKDGDRDTDRARHLGTRILIGEDNAVSRALLLDMLDTLGYTAHGVADGRAALAALDAEPYDVVLLDCQMPEMDGYEVAAELRSRETGSERPVIIAVTAHASADDRERCLRAGMDDYLSKPVRLEGLAEMLEEWVPSAAEAAEAPSASAISLSAAEYPLDAGTWERLRGETDPAFLDGLIELFLSDTETRLAALSESLEQGRVEGVARDAHALKAGCLQVGATHMAELCDAIHRAGRAAPPADLSAMLECLLDEFSQVRAFLEGRRPTNPLTK